MKKSQTDRGSTLRFGEENGSGVNEISVCDIEKSQGVSERGVKVDIASKACETSDPLSKVIETTVDIGL